MCTASGSSRNTNKLLPTGLHTMCPSPSTCYIGPWCSCFKLNFKLCFSLHAAVEKRKRSWTIVLNYSHLYQIIFSCECNFVVDCDSTLTFLNVRRFLTSWITIHKYLTDSIMIRSKQKKKHKKERTVTIPPSLSSRSLATGIFFFRVHSPKIRLFSCPSEGKLSHWSQET